jgi:hypothetical protein
MSKRERNPEIYIKGYSRATTKDQLRNLFRPFGRIMCVQMKRVYTFIVP